MMKKKLTMEEAVKLHRKLWMGIYEFIKSNDLYNPSLQITCAYDIKRKIIEMDYPEMIDTEEYPYSYCFLCEYVRQQTLENICTAKERILYCPLYDLNKKNDNCLNGLYRKFDNFIIHKDFLRARRLAKRIANLPIIER